MNNQYIQITLLFLVIYMASYPSFAQTNQDPTGGWYTYNWNTSFGETNWGLDGEIQNTNYSIGKDLNWFLVRAGVTYAPKNTQVKFALGYGHATFGAFGPDDSKVNENRIYQQLNLPQEIAGLNFLHRFRYEQRFFNGFYRSRLRYGLYLNLPINNKTIVKNTFYVALYNELFLNGERQLKNGSEVAYFDQNRTYGAVGFAVSKTFKIQLGVMRLIRANDDRITLQFSLHHSI